ncbi:hypothetical protein VTH82DRAFT_5647 [Thermothelomyces myriococcoides]
MDVHWPSPPGVRPSALLASLPSSLAERLLAVLLPLERHLSWRSASVRPVDRDPSASPGYPVTVDLESKYVVDRSAAAASTG